MAAQWGKGLLSLDPTEPVIQVLGLGVGQTQAHLRSPLASQPRGKGEPQAQ